MCKLKVTGVTFLQKSFSKTDEYCTGHTEIQRINCHLHEDYRKRVLDTGIEVQTKRFHNMKRKMLQLEEESKQRRISFQKLDTDNILIKANVICISIIPWLTVQLGLFDTFCSDTRDKKNKEDQLRCCISTFNALPPACLQVKAGTKTTKRCCTISPC